MKQTFIIQFFGQTSPATIKQFAAVTHDNDGQWLVSKIHFIDDHVVGLIELEIDDTHKELIKAIFENHPNLTVKISDHQHSKSATNPEFHLNIESADKMGLINEITHLLDGQSISVSNIDSQRLFVSNSEGVTQGKFIANFSINLPKNLFIDDIINEMEALLPNGKVTLGKNT